MLVVSDMAHMRKCITFAVGKGKLPELLERLWYLHTYASGEGSEMPPILELADLEAFPPRQWQGIGNATTCRLMRDFAPASWEFVLLKAGDVWFNGGLVYHGDQSGWELADGSAIPPGHGVDPLSVRIGNDRNPWSVHT